MAPASLVRQLMSEKPSKRASSSSSTTTKRKRTHRGKKKRSTSKRKAAAAKTTKSVAPAKPVGDKCEYSPTSRAKCQGCSKKIQQGQQRIGKEEYYPQTQGYIHRYYHVACYQAQFPSLQLPSQRSIADELHHVQQQSLHAQDLLRQRVVLRKQLQRLRHEFAKRLMKNDFIIFPDATLDDLVIKLPRNKQEMLQIHGIAETRYQNFGRSILQVIAQYNHHPVDTAATAAAVSVRRTNTTTTTAAAQPRKRQRVEPPVAHANSATSKRKASAAAQKEVILIDDDDSNHRRRRPNDRTSASASSSGNSTRKRTRQQNDVIVIDTTDDDDDDDDDEEDDDDDDFEEDEEGIMMGKSLSCEEIVQQKFDHAAKNNYIISVD